MTNRTFQNKEKKGLSAAQQQLQTRKLQKMFLLWMHAIWYTVNATYQGPGNEH